MGGVLQLVLTSLTGYIPGEDDATQETWIGSNFSAFYNT